MNTLACPYPVRPRLVLKNFVLAMSWTKIFSLKSPSQKARVQKLEDKIWTENSSL